MSKILKPEDISEDDLRVPARIHYQILLVHRKRDEKAVILSHLASTACNEFVFTSVASASDALVKMKEMVFDLVVLALDLPEGQELDGFLSLKKAFPEVPVVILSDWKNREVAMAAVKEGAHDFIISSPSYPIELVKLRLLYSIERSRTEKSVKSIARTEKFVLRSVVENAPLMFLRLDQGYLLRDCNRNLGDVLQVPREQLRRKSIFSLIPEFSPEDVERLASGGHLIKKKLTLWPRHSSPLDVYWNCYGWTFFKSNGEDRETVIVAIDVTREAELDDFREEFVAALAHDIKNPILGQEKVLSSLIAANPQLPEDVSTILLALRNSNLQLLNFLNTLVDIYRLDLVENTPVPIPGTSINDAIEQQFDELKCIASVSDKSIILELASDLPSAALEQTSAYRVVANLVHNALQNAPLNTEIHIRTYTKEDDVVLEVTNHGAIPEAEIPSLFKRFSKSSDGRIRTNSFGLGLYFCKKTIERFGGSIACFSEASAGTTFIARLPKKASQPNNGRHTDNQDDN